jgi:hypothetical protein
MGRDVTISYVTSLKSTRMQAVIDAIDGNAAGPGTVEIGTAAMAAVLAVITLALPSFTESGGVITMTGLPLSGIASAAGNAANARIKDGGGNIVATNLTVGTSGADIIVDSIVVSLGEAITLTSATVTHGP